MKSRIDFILPDGIEKSWEIEHDRPLHIDKREVWDGLSIVATLSSCWAIRVTILEEDVQHKAGKKAEGGDDEARSAWGEVFGRAPEAQQSWFENPKEATRNQYEIGKLKEALEIQKAVKETLRIVKDGQIRDLKKRNDNQAETIKQAGEELRRVTAQLHSSQCAREVLLELRRQTDEGYSRAFDAAEIRAKTEHETAQKIADWLWDQKQAYIAPGEYFSKQVRRGDYRQVKP